MPLFVSARQRGVGRHLRPETPPGAELFPVASELIPVRSGVLTTGFAALSSAAGELDLQQSVSVVKVQPVGQQESAVEPEQAVIAARTQATSQFAALPCRRSTVQASPSSGQAVGQVAGGSQVSPPPIRPSPHIGWQSLSVDRPQPAGQQPSPSMQPVTG
jgi:hypothetical protein